MNREQTEACEGAGVCACLHKNRQSNRKDTERVMEAVKK